MIWTDTKTMLNTKALGNKFTLAFAYLDGQEIICVSDHYECEVEFEMDEETLGTTVHLYFKNDITFEANRDFINFGYAIYNESKTPIYFLHATDSLSKGESLILSAKKKKKEPIEIAFGHYLVTQKEYMFHPAKNIWKHKIFDMQITTAEMFEYFKAHKYEKE